MCTPAMFWLAECAGVDERTLVKAEDETVRAAKINSMDGHPHGKFIREAVSWSSVKVEILSRPILVETSKAEIESLKAFDRLCCMRVKYRKIRTWESFRSSVYG